MHIADRPVGEDLATLSGLFGFDDPLAEIVHGLYGQPAAAASARATALPTPTPQPFPERRLFRRGSPTRDALERLCELGLIVQTGGSQQVVPIGEAIEAGWRWREREAQALFDARQWEAAAQHAHFLATAALMAAAVAVIRPADEDEWFTAAVLRVRHAVNAVPPVPATLVRMAASWTATDVGVALTNIARNGATMESTCDWARLTQFRERAYESAVIDALPGSTLAEGRVALRVSVLDDDLTLIPTSVTTGTGITVVRSRRYASFVRAFIVRETRPVVLSGAPDIEPLAMDVLRLLAAGAKDDAIARRLAVSDRTVRRLIATLMLDLEAESRFQLGLRAARAGLI